MVRALYTSQEITWMAKRLFAYDIMEWDELVQNASRATNAPIPAGTRQTIARDREDVPSIVCVPVPSV